MDGRRCGNSVDWAEYEHSCLDESLDGAHILVHVTVYSVQRKFPLGQSIFQYGMQYDCHHNIRRVSLLNLKFCRPGTHYAGMVV